MRWFPTIGASAVLTANSIEPSGGHTIDGSVGVNASWAIFDAGSRTADARSRDASAAIADLTTHALARTIDSEVRSAVVTLVASQQSLAAAKDAMDASRKGADEESVLYRQGLAKAIELIDANEQRFTAEVSYAEAQFAVASAYLALRQAIGLEPLGKGLE
jgi:outer membrane protein TolC